MTIDEAIAHARKVAERKKKAFQNCKDDCRFCLASKPCNESAEEHEQLAEWLEELKLYKQGNCTNDCEHFDNGVKYGYNKAIDDFAGRLEKLCLYKKIDGILYTYKISESINKIAEQLKGGNVI